MGTADALGGSVAGRDAPERPTVGGAECSITCAGIGCHRFLYDANCADCAHCYCFGSEDKA